jgi:serine/threonine protein kinase
MKVNEMKSPSRPLSSNESSDESVPHHQHTDILHPPLHRDASLHDNLIRISRKGDVLKKYHVVKVIGTGSMGTVSIVQVRDDKVGGSAFESYSKGLFGTTIGQKHKTTPIQERPPKSTNYLYAMKTIQLDRISTIYIDELYNEISILRTLDHPNIIKAIEVYHETNGHMKGLARKQLYIVLELCTGGDLYKRSPYSPKDAARYIDKLVSAVQYMHSMNVVHRDLKFENVLFENNEPECEIKIIDFGLSKKFVYGTQRNYMTERVGTMYV